MSPYTCKGCTRSVHSGPATSILAHSNPIGPSGRPALPYSRLRACINNRDQKGPDDSLPRLRLHFLNQGLLRWEAGFRSRRTSSNDEKRMFFPVITSSTALAGLWTASANVRIENGRPLTMTAGSRGKTGIDNETFPVTGFFHRETFPNGRR